MQRLSDDAPSRAIQVGDWSHEALRHSRARGIPLREGLYQGKDINIVRCFGDRRKSFSVELPHFSPKLGDGFVYRRIDERDVGYWLHGAMAAFPAYMTSNPRLRAERESQVAKARLVSAAFAEFDWLGWDLRNSPERHKADFRIEASDKRRRLKKALRRIMQSTLKPNIGQAVPRSSVYEAFVARGIEVDFLGACESCHVVFESLHRMANFCKDCQRSRPRHQMYPVIDGGWHLEARLGPPRHRYLDGKPGRPREIEYLGACVECSGQFVSRSSRKRLCLNCGGSSGRVRRHRRGSSKGRQLFQFVASEGLLSSVSVQFPDGTHGALTATDGIVVTDDAEVAAQLKRNMSLQEAPKATSEEPNE